MSGAAHADFEVVIGLEVHTQLRTESKLFSPAPVTYGRPPNHAVHPICLALPGVLPVLNARAVELAIRTALATHCNVHPRSIFARKNYFYPDLPKGYQISQFEDPIATRGWIEIAIEDGSGSLRTKRVGLTRIHMEEDAGKSIHDAAVVGSDSTHVDLNRAGVPLLEIVSEPDLRSPAEAAAYLRTLRQLLRYIEVSDADMEKGHFRCDANVSLRRPGESKLGTRTELKNLNSFRYVETALEAEIERQAGILEGGGRVVQATLAFDPATRRTRVLRLKENADDYRYFPDPDLIPLQVSEEQIARVRESLPELAEQKCARFQRDHGLSEYDARQLTSSRPLAEFFEQATAAHGSPKAVANWMLRDLREALAALELEIEAARITPQSLAALMRLVDEGRTTAKSARELMPVLVKDGGDPAGLVRERGLEAVSDAGVLDAAVAAVIAENAENVQRYRAGEEKVLNFLMGQVMRRTGGKASPAAVRERLARRLSGGFVKALRRLALAAASLALLAAVALAVLLPRIVASDAVRARIASAAQTALGRELAYERLEVGWFPPALVVVAPVVAGDGPGAPPFAEAQKVSLRLALAPLLVRALVIDALVVDDAVLRLRRSARGFELSRAREAEAADAGPAGAEAASKPARSDFALRRLVLRDATILLEDHTVSPVVRWELRDVQAKLRGSSLEAPLRLEGSFALASGGRVEASGSAGLDGELDLEVELDSVALAPLAPYLDPRARFAGSLSGSVTVEGPASSPNRIAAQLLLRDGDVQLDEISLRGPLRVAADLSGGFAAPSGSFDLDATDAELVYGGAFHKPPGTSAKVTGRLVSGPAGALGVDDVKLRIHGLDATAKLRTGESRVLDLSAPDFDLAGWETLFPALAGWQLRGPVHSEGLALARAPLDLRGRIRLDGVEARPPGREFIALRGALVGAGDRIRSEGLELIAAEQVLRLEADLSSLDTRERRYQLHMETSDSDVDRLLTALAGRRDAMHGRLALTGDLAIRASGVADPVQALAGRVRFEIRDGRVASGKSLLGTVLGALAKPLGAIGGLRLPGPEARHDDRFDSASGTFDVAQGFARTQDLRIVQRTRSLELRGSIRLADLALDMVGGLVLDLPLASSGGAAGDTGGQRIPIAHVRGTLDDPRVEVTPQAVRKVAAALSPGKLGRQLERVLDPSAAEGLVKGLGSLLGGGPREEK